MYAANSDRDASPERSIDCLKANSSDTVGAPLLDRTEPQRYWLVTFEVHAGHEGATYLFEYADPAAQHYLTTKSRIDRLTNSTWQQQSATAISQERVTLALQTLSLSKSTVLQNVQSRFNTVFAPVGFYNADHFEFLQRQLDRSERIFVLVTYEVCASHTRQFFLFAEMDEAASEGLLRARS